MKVIAIYWLSNHESDLIIAISHPWQVATSVFEIGTGTKLHVDCSF